MEGFRIAFSDTAQFISECVELLLQYGADPRIEDVDGTMAFDLAQSDDIRTILHDAAIKADTKKEEIGIWVILLLCTVFQFSQLIQTSKFYKHMRVHCLKLKPKLISQGHGLKTMQDMFLYFNPMVFSSCAF